jgi:hypothetical protein
MVKQVNTNKTSKFEEEIQDKFNKTTIFLTKFLFGPNLDVLKNAGFVDSYVKDPDILNMITLSPKQRLLFLLFKTKKMTTNQLRKIVEELSTENIGIVFSYELVNNYSMIVIDFPERLVDDYDRVVVGAYSKLTEGYKSGFPPTRDVFNDKKQRVGAEWTIYTHIFNKTQWLQNFWMEKLGLSELDPTLELWSKPTETDLIFNKKNII